MDHDLFQVLPDFTFGSGIPQEIGRMIRGKQGQAAEFKPLTAQARNGLLRANQRLEGHSAEANNRFRTNHVQLAIQKRGAGLDFVGLRRSIFRRPTFDHVANVNLVSTQTHRFDHLREQLARSTDERQSLDIFVAARPFTDKDELCVLDAGAKHDVCAFLTQLASLAVPDVSANSFERVALDPFGGVE